MENGTRNGEPAALSVVAQEMTAMDLSSPPHSPPARQPSPPFVQRWVAYSSRNNPYSSFLRILEILDVWQSSCEN